MTWTADEPVTQVALQMATDSMPLDAKTDHIVQRAEAFKRFLLGDDPAGRDLNSRIDAALAAGYRFSR